MIPRLRLARFTHQQPSWPDPPEHDNIPGSHLFEGRPTYRNLVVVADNELIDVDPSSGINRAHLLAGLLSDPYVRTYRYLDAGAPGAPPFPVADVSTSLPPEPVPGWLQVGPKDSEHGLVTWPVIYMSQPGVWAFAAVSGNAVEVAAADANSKVYADLGEAKAALRREADALACQAAEAIGADIYITDRPYLVQEATWLTREILAVGVEEALPIVSLYLRAQGHYPSWRNPSGGGSHEMNRGLFFWVGTRELLPEAWRWFAACVQRSMGTSDDRVLMLGQSVLQRVDRSLRLRDELHIALNRSANNDTAEDLLEQLDGILLLLMGALDAMARVAHDVVGLTATTRYTAGWQKDHWRNQVRTTAANLAALVDDGTDHSEVLTVLRLLRNSVHAEALRQMGVTSGQQRKATLVQVPAEQVTDVLAAVDALGGRANWGFQDLLAGRALFDPGVFVERLFPMVLAMINDLMEATPVERLAHVTITPAETKPPDEAAPTNTFSEFNRKSIRWQLGL